jgi:thiol:disulfide interchange protein/DsbC/DsbD-like thiol-disulfide interchange protein
LPFSLNETSMHSLFTTPRVADFWRALIGAAAAVCTAVLTAFPVQAQLLDRLLKSEPVSTALLVQAPEGIAPGRPFWLGLQLKHHGDWHTYWQNPGDSGLPTRLHWELPAGLSAGDIAWPLPKKFPLGPLTNYGYDGTILLLVPVEVASDFRPPADGQVSIGLKANLLVCSNVCVPQDVSLTLTVPAHGASTMPASRFEAAHRAIPAALPGPQAVELADGGRILAVRVEGLPQDWRGQTLSLFPITPQVVSNSAVQDKDWAQRWEEGTWTARMPVAADRAESPTRMRWLVARGPETSPRGPAFEFEAPIAGRWPSPAPIASTHATGPATEESPSTTRQARAAAAMASTTPAGLALALLGAFVGGLILNLMPCVFPVLALKVFAVVRSQGTGGQQRLAGLAYTSGVVLTFSLLGALLLGLRTAGQELGWGFQLQSPLVVTLLALLFTLIGLNFAGVFDFGRLLPDSLASRQLRHPVMNSALSGLLAGIVASPCTAPFMGAAIGLAITLPVAEALLVFVALGLGMAAPILAVSFWPALARVLPRPGPWLATFRKALAYPMFATVLWLLWVLGQQTHVDTVISVLGAALALALLSWSLTLRGLARLLGGVVSVGALAIGGWSSGLLGPPTATSHSAPAAPAASSARWSAWSEDELQSRLAGGQAVFVDFTAAWCVTCQFNKLTVLGDSRVLAALDEHKVATLRADWTRRDPRITKALNELGRNGVPVYVLYAPGRPAVVLSEVLTVDEIKSALGSL